MGGGGGGEQYILYRKRKRNREENNSYFLGEINPIPFQCDMVKAMANGISVDSCNLILRISTIDFRILIFCFSRFAFPIFEFHILLSG